MEYDMKTNGKDELEQILTTFDISKESILCADLSYWVLGSDAFSIQIGADQHLEDIQRFIDELDFVYFKELGQQKLTGTIWLVDRSWMARRLLDGIEQWEVYRQPRIPSKLVSTWPTPFLDLA